MTRYRTYLERLYPALLAVYDRLDFPKVKIDGTLSANDVARAVQEAMVAMRQTAAQRE